MIYAVRPECRDECKDLAAASTEAMDVTGLGFDAFQVGCKVTAGRIACDGFKMDGGDGSFCGATYYPPEIMVPEDIDAEAQAVINGINELLGEKQTAIETALAGGPLRAPHPDAAQI